MPYQAETTFVPVMPSFRGFTAAMIRGTGSGSAKAGAAAGTSFAKSFSAATSKADRANTFAAFEKKVADSVTAASRKMNTARTAEADASRKVRIEELKLQELRDGGRAKASQLATAEDRLTRAQRTLSTAQDQTRKSTQDYDDAIGKGTRSLSQARRAAGLTATSFERLGSKLKGFASAGFSKISATASRTGLDVGKKLELGMSKTSFGRLGLRFNSETRRIVGGALNIGRGIGGKISAGVNAGLKLRAGAASAFGLEKLSSKAGATGATIGKKLGGGLLGVAAKFAGPIGLAFGAVSLVRGFDKSISLASKFDQSMRLVSTTLGVTGKGMKSLTNLAISMGAKTSFSAQGASDAMVELAKGGLSSAQIKAGALSETLKLATAGGLSLGNASTYIVQGLTSFGVRAEDAGRVSTALAGAANASTASVESMGQALSQVGPAAKTAGLSIEDTTAALAAFDNAGIKGQDAGTSLKTFLQRLVPTTVAAQQQMKAYGLVTFDAGRAMDFLRSKGIKPAGRDAAKLTQQLQQYAMKVVGAKTFTNAAQKEFVRLATSTGAMSNAFFDAKGNIKSVTDLAGVMQKALAGQTKQQKLATLTTLFGSDAARAAAVLADQGAKGLAKFARATRDKTAADDLANNATQGFAGAMERFHGAVETAQIAFGTKFLPILTKVLDYASNSGIPTFTALGKILGGTFADGINAASGGFGRFIDYLSTHQADVIVAFQRGGNAVFDFGKVVAATTAAGLRQFGDFTTSATASVLGMVGGLLRAFDHIPGINLGDSIRSFEQLETSANQAAGKSRADLYSLADGIDTKVVPGLSRMQRKFSDSANTEIVSARQRDALAKTTAAIDRIGTRADGSQLYLKKFADVSKLSATQQRGLTGRINDARLALRDQLKAVRSAHGGQKQLTEAWDTGRKRLYDEFRQMGLSRAEAKRLAAQYAGVKPKVQTRFTTPGAAAAQGAAIGLDNAINGINSKTAKVKIQFTTNASGAIYNLNRAYTDYAKRISSGNPRLASGGVWTIGSSGPRALKYANAGVLPGWSPGRDIHRFWSPTGGSLDLSGGEAVMRPEFTRTVGGPGGVARLNAQARSGQLDKQAFAQGGVYRLVRTLVDHNTPPSPQKTVDQAGILGEGIGSSYARAIGKVYGKAIDDAYDRARKQAQEAAAGGDGGGKVAGGGYAKALGYAKAHRGHPYVYATIWDCSGFMGSLQSIIYGQQPHRRYATPAFHGAKAQGFTRNKRSAFMIGVNPNPGKSGHMAGTLNGVNVEEAGGVGLRVGPSARGWRSPMFSWRGGLADGGVVGPIPGRNGDLPYDVVNSRGQRYDPAAKRLVDLVYGGRLNAGTYDAGGILPPGLTLAYNGTGKAETIRTQVQERRLTERTARTTSYDGAVFYGYTPADVVREARMRDRLDDVLYGAVA